MPKRYRSNAATKRPRKRMRTVMYRQPTTRVRPYLNVAPQKPRLEYKMTDARIDASSATTTPYFIDCLAAIERGTDYFNQFIGNFITPKSFTLRYQVTGSRANTLAAADTNNMTRLLLIQWLDEQTPTATDIFQGSAQYYLATLNPRNLDKINVLRDIQVSTWATSTDSSDYNSSNSECGKIYIKGKKMAPIKFVNGSTTTTSGGIYLIAISDSANTPHPFYEFFSRLLYVD